MPPQRFPGSSAGSATPAASFEAIKSRVLTRLDDRLGPSASKRMPPSLLHQSLRTFADQIADQEARSFSKPDRDRLVEEVLAEFLGYGPLDELFRDPSVREVLVAGPHAVITRGQTSHWMPTSVKFRDEDHLLSALDRLATHAEPVGPVTTSVNWFDLKLPNGFRAVGVIPPPALGQSATAAFMRCEPDAVPRTLDPSMGYSSSRCPTLPVPGSPLASPRPGSHPVDTPAPRSSPVESPIPGDPLTRYRNRIIERLITKLASLGVYDIQRVEVTELRKAVVAYIDEHCVSEKIYLHETDRGRLLLEIMAAMGR